MERTRWKHDPALSAGPIDVLRTRPGHQADRLGTCGQRGDDRVEGVVGSAAQVGVGAEVQPWGLSHECLQQRLAPWPALSALVALMRKSPDLERGGGIDLDD